MLEALIAGQRDPFVLADLAHGSMRGKKSHLVSWAKYAPKAKQSAGKSKPGTTGKGNPWIASALGEAGIGAARTKTFLGSRYHRLARRRGKQRALVAVGNSILTIVWHLLS